MKFWQPIARPFLSVIVLQLLTLTTPTLQADESPMDKRQQETAALTETSDTDTEAHDNKQSRVVKASAEEGIGGSDEPADVPPEKADETEAVSDAERIGRLQRSIEKDKAQLLSLREELKSAEEEFAKAGRIFNKVDERLNDAKTVVKELSEGAKPEQTAKANDDLKNIEEKWTLCKERFDLSIQSKKGLQQQIAALGEKIEQDEAALAKLTGVEEAAAPATLPSPDGGAVPTVLGEETTTAPTTDAPSLPSPSTTPAAKASIVAMPKAEVADNGEAAADVQQARTEASRHEAAASEARAAVAAIEKRQQSLDKNIELEQQLRDAARKQADNALRVEREFQQDYHEKSAAGAPAEELTKINERIQSAELRLEKAREETKRRTDRLDELQAQRHALMSDRILAMEQVEAQQRVADEARRKLQSLENPFSRRNLMRWVVIHSPNIVVILICFLVLRLTVRVVCRRVVTMMTHKGHGTRKERENRAETIVSVFHNAATVLCYGGSTLMILEECGVPVGPLLGGAAVIGLAVAFGSQNLIRDYFYGFVILLENQYGINDIVKIGEITGQVERITLRMTVVRDMDGVNFIPNGRVESVKNLTHGWSRAVLEISVSYREDLDRVMDVLLDLGRELRKDPQYHDVILEDPTMLGVEQLGDSSVVIKMFLKTKPLEQWSVKREMLRRVKRRFDELDIEIPYPQRVVNHRYLPAEESSAGEDQAGGWQSRKSA